MGCCSSLCAVEGAVDHWIYVKSNDHKGTGAGASFSVILYNNNEQATAEIPLDLNFGPDFARGQTDVFQAPPLIKFGDVTKIELWREASGFGNDWLPEVIVVNDRKSEQCYYFPVHRWIRPDIHYYIRQYDTSLPQSDPELQQRNEELTNKLKDYRYKQESPALPVQIRSLPTDEVFSDSHDLDITRKMMDLLIQGGFSRVTHHGWDSLKDLTNIYGGSFPQPTGVSKWSNDISFGAQRLVGCNPTQIRLCTSLPENMAITAEMLRPFLEGWSLPQIIEAKRLFMVDHKLLDGIKTKDDKPIPAPIALFFLTGDKQLVPIAIQLYQDITPTNPVFLPNDPPFTWLFAKAWFNVADSNIQQAVTRFGCTHMIMEGVSIATHRCLAYNHPLFRLLAPHFLFLLASNEKSMREILHPGGWFDSTLQLGRIGALEAIKRRMVDWRIDIDGCLPRELESRGLLDTRVLPGYSYRDDALLVYKIINNYVKKIVHHYYPSVEAIKSDTELQNWAAELARSTEHGGVGINGMPNDGRMLHVEDICLVCTSVIFTCTAQYAAVTSPQYDDFGFPPHYPGSLAGDPPSDRTPRSEDEIVSVLPTRRQTVDMMALTRLLSEPTAKALGDWEFQWQFDPPAVSAEKELRKELQEVSRQIKLRNDSRVAPYVYPHLDPETIPNRISI